jgi:hypothetical protein
MVPKSEYLELVYEIIFNDLSPDEIWNGVTDLLDHDEIDDIRFCISVHEDVLKLYEMLYILLDSHIGWLRDNNYETIVSYEQLHNGTSLRLIKESSVNLSKHKEKHHSLFECIQPTPVSLTERKCQYL